jgi:hypothetical protein
VQWQVGLVNQPLGEMQALRVCDRQWRCPEVLCKQAPQMATGDAEPVRKLLDRTVIQRSVSYQP